jgi:hypothetical protein
MKTFLTILILFTTVQTWATTWATIYPYTQKTENGKVKIKSFPYDPFHGGNGPGETFVYYKGKHLYTIDKYFTTPFFTSENGKYLIEVDFYLNFRNPIGIIYENGVTHQDPISYDGDAVRIYENGELKNTIKFSELKIDTSKININKYGQWFSWNYRSNDSTSSLKEKMENFPAFLLDGDLHVITSDNQLVILDIESATQSNVQNAENYFDQKENWKPIKIKRKFHKVKYPEKFSLPKLVNGKTIDQALSGYLNKEPADDNRDSSTVKIYFHTLLINDKGECEDIYVSPSTRSDMQKDYNPSDDKMLKEQIEKWAREQKFDTKTIPKHFRKYKYLDFVYLK